jgi:hypothetical protein
MDEFDFLFEQEPEFEPEDQWLDGWWEDRHEVWWGS